MIHPGLEALKNVETDRIRSGIPGASCCDSHPTGLHTIPGNAAGKMPILRHSNSPGMTVSSRRAGKTAYTNTWGLLFDAGGDARLNGISF